MVGFPNVWGGFFFRKQFYGHVSSIAHYCSAWPLVICAHQCTRHPDQDLGLCQLLCSLPRLLGSGGVGRNSQVQITLKGMPLPHSQDGAETEGNLPPCKDLLLPGLLLVLWPNLRASGVSLLPGFFLTLKKKPKLVGATAEFLLHENRGRFSRSY